VGKARHRAGPAEGWSGWAREAAAPRDWLYRVLCPPSALHGSACRQAQRAWRYFRL